MKYWNKYLTIGVLILLSNKFIDYSEVILKWTILIVGISFASYGLFLFLKKKKQG